MANDYPGLTPTQMNRVLPYLYRGQTVEEAIAVSDASEADVREFWDETAEYMAANPLPPGHVWDMVPE